MSVEFKEAVARPPPDQHTRLHNDDLDIGGPPSGATRVRSIKRTGTIVGIEIDAPTRSDVFISENNAHVAAVLQQT